MEKKSLSETRDFIRSRRKDDVHVLALQAGKYPQVDMQEAVIQIAGWQIAEKKIPSWASTEGIRYPQHLSMEQCSSEITARYKASLVEGDAFADLTGGFGVDCSFIARRFLHAHYVERQETLCIGFGAYRGASRRWHSLFAADGSSGLFVSGPCSPG